MNSSGRRGVVVTGVVTLLAWGALSAPALAASTVSYSPRDKEDGEVIASDITIRGDDGVNNVTLTLSADEVLVADTSGLTATAGGGCTQVSPTSASCPKPDFADVTLFGGNDVFSAPSSLIVGVEAGEGNDSITGRTGNVNTSDDEGRTYVFGEKGDDTLFVSGYANGDEGDDMLAGGDGDDLLDGGFGSDTITGGAGDDELIGGDTPGDSPGKDDVAGEAGNDLLTGGNSSRFQRGGDTEDDDVDGGDGTDTLDWGARQVAVTVDLANPAPDGADGEKDRLTSIENVNTGGGDDTIVGVETGSVIDPGGGADAVTGGAGDDFVQAGDNSSDTIALGAGSDTVSYEQHNGPVTVDLSDTEADGPSEGGDSLSGVENALGTPGTDVLVGDDGPNILVGLNGEDRLSGGGGDDALYGEGRAEDFSREGRDEFGRPTPRNLCECGSNGDRLNGGDGADLLEGGLDSDKLDGGVGDDTIRGDLPKSLGGKSPGRDIVDYSSRTGDVAASVGTGGGEGAESDKYTQVEGIRGGSGDDTLTGRAKKRDRLFGGAGGDTLRGKTGKDRLFGQAGRDRVVANDGEKDRANCGSGRDEFWADEKDRVVKCERRGDGPGPAPAVCTSAGASVGCVLPARRRPA
jgi:Ca2+-binding RTX toxin-like protein